MALEILTAREVQDVYGISRSTLYRMKDKGVLHPTRLSEKRVGWRLHDIESYLTSINEMKGAEND